MATVNEQNAYKQKMSQYAQQASAALNMPASVILAQWAWETGYGMSELSRNANNHAGIKVPRQRQSLRSGTYTIGSNVYSAYSSISAFTQDYILNMRASMYAPVLAASSVEDTLTALGASPWAESPYRDSQGRAGWGLMSIIDRLGLRSLDGGVMPSDQKKTKAECPACGASLSLGLQ